MNPNSRISHLERVARHARNLCGNLPPSGGHTNYDLLMLLRDGLDALDEHEAQDAESTTAPDLLLSVRLPTIHSNGTHPRELYGQAVTVMSAVDKLRLALWYAWPNGRDYYPQGPDALLEAREAWVTADDSARKIHEMAERIAGHCADAL